MSLYDELELASSCTEEDIKKQYRRLASIHHPDKGGNEEKFKRLKLAYEVLSDPARRIKYDSTGKTYEEIGIRSDAIQQLSLLLNHIINDCDPSTTNFIIALKFEINHQIQGNYENIKRASNCLIKLNNAREKLVLVKESENIMEGLILNLVEVKNNDIKAFNYRIKVCNDMLEILNDYSYGFLTISEFT